LHSDGERAARALPVALAWDLPLNNALEATPAFNQARGYFPIEGHRIAAYDVEHGTLLWIARRQAQSQPALGDDLVFIDEPDAITALHDDTGVVAAIFVSNERWLLQLVWSNGWLVAERSPARSSLFVARMGT